MNCEGMNALLRGVSGATAVINTIVERVGANPDNETEIHRLMTIKELINVPSKYDMCVEILKPCLPTGKLEDAEQKCLDGTCTTCGFERLWSRTLRRKLFIVPALGQDEILNESSPLVDAELKESSIDWRHYTHETIPTAGKSCTRHCAAGSGGTGSSK